jgi:hypothetical protein
MIPPDLWVAFDIHRRYVFSSWNMLGFYYLASQILLFGLRNFKETPIPIFGLLKTRINFEVTYKK